MLHHPLYNGLFGTVGPARDELLALCDAHRPALRAVLAGHIHYNAAFDGDGVSAGLAPAGGALGFLRWPLHYSASRSTLADGGYALVTVGAEEVGYRWVALPSP